MLLFMHYFNTVHALFMRPTATLFKKNILKIGPTVLFTHLKIILLQCFQFSVSTTMSLIQTDPRLLPRIDDGTHALCFGITLFNDLISILFAEKQTSDSMDIC